MRKVGTPKLSLEDFVYDMMSIPSRQLTIATLKELVSYLDLSDDLIQQHIHFTPSGYARNLVCRTPRFDMLVLCWKPNQVTTIHDHAGSLNVTRVFNGELTSRLYEEAHRPAPGRSIVKLRSEEKMGTEGFSVVDHGEIHQLANTSERDLVTVHVYAKPLRDITVYCPNTGEIEQRTLRYNLEDDIA
jgi:cysteine dioxygenase